MTENIDADVIKKTQDMLGKYVKKPPLTDKLLRKPPFKFILDIVKAVIRDTKFLEDLYTDDELNAEKDRDGKMKFLQKLIDVMKIVTQQDLQVKTSKIVAGLEAEKTNELLQAIAMAIQNNVDSKEAVIAVKNGAVIEMKTKPSSKPDQKSKAAKPVRTQSRDRTPAKPETKKPVTSQRSLEKKTTSKEKEKPASKEKPATKLKTINDRNESRKLKKTASKENEAIKSDEKIVTNGSVEHKEISVSPPRQNSDEKDGKTEEVILAPENHQNENEDEKREVDEPKMNGDLNHSNNNHENHLVNNSHMLEVEKEPENVKSPDELAAIIDEEAEFRRKEKSTKKLSSRHRQKSLENENHEKQSEQPQPLQESNHQKQPHGQQAEKIERFQSSFKRESLDRPRTSLRPPSARPASSRPAAPRRRDKNIEIVLQTDEIVPMGNIQVKMENISKELEDDGENLVIIEDPSASSDATSFINERLSKNMSVESESVPSDHGHLVQQILETEKNFEGALGMDGEQEKKTDIEFDESRNQSNLKQIENLKDLIQKLVRSLNPMGKLMDYVQEDIDSMQREYSKWNEIYKQAAMDLKREQSETQAAIEPLRFQLNQLEKSCIEHHQLIDQLRGNLMISENKINKLFTDV